MHWHQILKEVSYLPKWKKTSFSFYFESFKIYSMSQNKGVCVRFRGEIGFVNACVYVSVSIMHLKVYRNYSTLHKDSLT
jgi:hypothetical protein